MSRHETLTDGQMDRQMAGPLPTNKLYQTENFQIIINAYSVDHDKAAHDELSHLDLH